MSEWDRLTRQLNDTIDRAMLGDQYRGIISAVPVPTQPAPPVTIADIERTMQMIYDAGLRYQPRLEFRYGEGVPEQLTTGLEMRPVRPGEPNLDAIYGIPMIPDASLAAGEWRIVDEFGNIRSLNNPALGIAVVLPAEPVWTYEPPAEGFRRFERLASEGGDILARIDAAIGDWEYGPDAFRSKPEDALTD